MLFLHLRDIFIKEEGYNNYDVMMNKDQLYSYIILNKGDCSDSIIEHTHKYILKQLYKKNYEVGNFYKHIKLFDNYKSTNNGVNLPIYVFFQALFHFNKLDLFRGLSNMGAR